MITSNKILDTFKETKLILVILLTVSILTISTLVTFDIPTSNASPAAINSSSAANNSITKLVESEGIVPISPQTVPEIIRVGDRFNIAASIVNYSPYIAVIPDGGCSPTGLSVTFENNVDVSPSGIQFLICNQETLTPGKTIPVIAGWPSENYTAISPGLTNATLHLLYSIQNNNTNSTSLHQYDQAFQFVIVP
jgi:hypothetical protein